MLSGHLRRALPASLAQPSLAEARALWAVVALSEGPTPGGLLPVGWDGEGWAPLTPLEARADLHWLWGQGDPGNTSLTDWVR